MICYVFVVDVGGMKMEVVFVFEDGVFVDGSWSC